MGRDLVTTYPVAKAVFREADQVLGFSISKLCFEGPEQELMLTANSQPAILTASIAVLRVVEQETGLRPDVVAGHSLGEYSALVCAGAMSLADAVRIVNKRGQFMQEAVPAGQGGMAAIMGMSLADLEAVCSEASGSQLVRPANFNASGQVVIAGHSEAVERATKLAQAKGALAKKLPVSAPFHCQLMEPAAAKLAAELKGVAFQKPAVPVVCNVDAELNSDPAKIPAFLVRQVTSPVQWEASVKRLAAMGVTQVYELGIGGTLTGLIRRIDKSLKPKSIQKPADIEALRQQGAQATPPAGTAARDDAAQQKEWLPSNVSAQVKRDGTEIRWPDGRVDKLAKSDWHEGVNATLCKNDGSWIVWPYGFAENYVDTEWAPAADGSWFKKDGTRIVYRDGFVRKYSDADWVVCDKYKMRRDGQWVVWPDGKIEELTDAEWTTRFDGARVRKDRTRIITMQGQDEQFQPDEWEVQKDGTWRKKDGARVIWADGMEWTAPVTRKA